MEYKKEQLDMLQFIINKDGDCFWYNRCANCPLYSACIGNAMSSGSFMIPEKRVQRAYDILFDTSVEQELLDE